MNNKRGIHVSWAHKVVHEGLVAAEVIAGELQGKQELAAAAFTHAGREYWHGG
jgi:hypothetical protein